MPIKGDECEDSDIEIDKRVEEGWRSKDKFNLNNNLMSKFF